MLTLVLAASGTALATGVGAVPVFFLGRRAEVLTPPLLGFAAGAMAVASIAGLLAPALDQGSVVSVGAGFGVGVAFLVMVRRRFGSDQTTFMGRSGPGTRSAALIFLVLLVHSLPEGLAIGTAFASGREGLDVFVVLAIALQNVPEGTSIALPMEVAGFGHWTQFWMAVATSAPQPVGAVVAFLLVEQISGLLPLSFGFAAGAILVLVAVEMLPKAYAGRQRVSPTVGVASGAALMLALSVALGV